MSNALSLVLVSRQYRIDTKGAVTGPVMDDDLWVRRLTLFLAAFPVTQCINLGDPDCTVASFTNLRHVRTLRLSRVMQIDGDVRIPYSQLHAIKHFSIDKSRRICSIPMRDDAFQIPSFANLISLTICDVELYAAHVAPLRSLESLSVLSQHRFDMNVIDAVRGNGVLHRLFFVTIYGVCVRVFMCLQARFVH